MVPKHLTPQFTKKAVFAHRQRATEVARCGGLVVVVKSLRDLVATRSGKDEANRPQR